VKKILDWLWHKARNMELVPASEINEETGTLDFNCTCLMCKWMGHTAP
jgi:hypothetical protein